MSDKTPCQNIQVQLKNLSFKAKVDELGKLTGKKQETGYAQTTSGVFTPLPVMNNGHSLDLSKINPSTLFGFIHTHLDDFETGKIVDSNPEISQNIRIFSPADVIKFLQIAKMAKDPSQVYATVITGSGNYTLKFTGNKDDIVNVKNEREYNEAYIDLIQKRGKEKGFLQFLKDQVKVPGVELYKLHKPLFGSTFTVQRKLLDANGKLISKDCI